MDRTDDSSQIRPMSIDDRVWLIRGIQDSINEDAELTDSENRNWIVASPTWRRIRTTRFRGSDVDNESLKPVRH